MCQKNEMTDEVGEEFDKAIKHLVEVEKVSGITGDCGFMMWFQKRARKQTHIPIFMSALAQLPGVTCAYG